MLNRLSEERMESALSAEKGEWGYYIAGNEFIDYLRAAYCHIDQLESWIRKMTEESYLQLPDAMYSNQPIPKGDPAEPISETDLHNPED